MTNPQRDGSGVGTLSALTGTTYGRLLLMKIAGLCALIGLGYLARRRIADGLQGPVAALRAVPMMVAAPPRVKARAAAPAGRTETAGALVVTRRGSGTGGGEPELVRMGVTLRRLRWSVAAETMIAIVVLAITAVLVNTPTARESYVPADQATTTFNTGGPGGRGTVRLTVTPARLGPNKFHLSVTSSNGNPYRPRQIQASLVLPARHLGPLPVRMKPAGHAAYLEGPAVLSTSGQWQLRITIRSDAFDEATVAILFSVR